MGFYEEISKYYDYIFPAGEEQLKFISEVLGAPVKKILDVACGSGVYSVELAEKGHRVTAVDLDAAMVEKARGKARNAGVDINVLKGSMTELEDITRESFDCIFCIGNSIVHLGSHDEILKAMEQMHTLLEDNGVLILQIINYDRIIKYGVNELPTIIDKDIGLEFVRKYIYNEQKGYINFNTLLTVGKSEDGERFENSIELLPLMSADMRKLLKNAGFNDIEFFGDFNYSTYDDKAYMMVVKARK